MSLQGEWMAAKSEAVINLHPGNEITVGREGGIGKGPFWIEQGGEKINFDREEAYEIVNALRYLAALYQRWEME